MPSVPSGFFSEILASMRGSTRMPEKSMVPLAEALGALRGEGAGALGMKGSGVEPIGRGAGGGATGGRAAGGGATRGRGGGPGVGRAIGGGGGGGGAYGALYRHRRWRHGPGGRLQATAGGGATAGAAVGADACHNTRRICSQEERTSRTSGTVPGQLRLGGPDRVEAALAAPAAVAEAALRRIAAGRTARTRAPSPGSCFRRMDSACSELYLVHSRHRSCSMLFSLGLGLTCQLL